MEVFILMQWTEYESNCSVVEVFRSRQDALQYIGIEYPSYISSLDVPSQWDCTEGAEDEHLSLGEFDVK